ncbi:MAG: phospholipid scramblase-related protein [Phycisphaerae bacterium]
MHPVLNRNTFFVKEHIGMFKAANNYDILDPETQETLIHCREPRLGMFTKFFRFTKYKPMTPFNVELTTPDGQPILQVGRGITLFRSRVAVIDENQQPLGGFKQKFFSLGGAFNVLDTNDQPMCMLKGKWTSWEFSFNTPDGRSLAKVTKQWAGLGKELFTSADNYVLSIDPSVPENDPVRPLIMGAVICIDMVLKE